MSLGKSIREPSAYDLLYCTYCGKTHSELLKLTATELELWPDDVRPFEFCMDGSDHDWEELKNYDGSSYWRLENDN